MQTFMKVAMYGKKRGSEVVLLLHPYRSSTESEGGYEIGRTQSVGYKQLVELISNMVRSRHDVCTRPWPDFQTVERPSYPLP